MSDAYTRLHGPTTGDVVRLADTGLRVQVEDDAQLIGSEFVTGYGKTARDGLHFQAALSRRTCDLVVSNVVLIDPILGIRKVSIGVIDGRIAAVGRAGNPDTLDDVDVVCGSGTTVIAGEGLIATPGMVDTHVHLCSPGVLRSALSAGTTTVLTQNFGPTWGCGVTSPNELHHALTALDAWPVNVAVLARGSSSDAGPLVRAWVAGAAGFKVHEDMGAHPRALATALQIAEEYDVQVALHTDTLNESMEVAGTLSVIAGRTVHAFHIEGCGGGHAPNVLELAGVPNVLGSSTTPTLPFTRDTIEEHCRMIATVHRLDPSDPSSLGLAHGRIRAGTLGAEDVLHDLGVIPIINSDSQGMGRIGETTRRAFAVAAKMRALDPAPPAVDNERVLRYVAKLTLNPAIAHGLAREVGSLEVGKLADVVLWDPRFFGAKPQLILKSGFPVWGATGDGNAATEICQPQVIGTQVGAYGATAAELSVAFVSQAAFEEGDSLRIRRRRAAVSNTRGVTMSDMVRNTRTGNVAVNVATGEVALDGAHISSPPTNSTPLGQLYFL